MQETVRETNSVALLSPDSADRSGASGHGAPRSLFEKFRERDRDAARKFYKKYLDVKGLPVVASADVADEALQRTHYIVTHLLAGRPDILETMAKNGTRLIIIGKDQVYTDMPEYRNSPNPAYLNERVRGTGGSGRHQLRRGEPAQPRRRPLRRREHRASTSSATPSTPPSARIDPDLARAARPDLPRRHRRRASGRTPTPAPTRPNTGPRSASRTSTATASTTGTTTPSPRASS